MTSRSDFSPYRTSANNTLNFNSFFFSLFYPPSNNCNVNMVAATFILTVNMQTSIFNLNKPPHYLGQQKTWSPDDLVLQHIIKSDSDYESQKTLRLTILQL